MGVASGFDPIAMLAQEVGDHVPDSRVVIDHENAGARGCHFGRVLHCDRVVVRA